MTQDCRRGAHTPGPRGRQDSKSSGLRAGQDVNRCSKLRMVTSSGTCACAAPLSWRMREAATPCTWGAMLLCFLSLAWHSSRGIPGLLCGLDPAGQVGGGGETLRRFARLQLQLLSGTKMHDVDIRPFRRHRCPSSWSQPTFYTSADAYKGGLSNFCWSFASLRTWYTPRNPPQNVNFRKREKCPALRGTLGTTCSPPQTTQNDPPAPQKVAHQHSVPTPGSSCRFGPFLEGVKKYGDHALAPLPSDDP